MTTPGSSSNSAAAVPISLYREVASELQSTQLTLESLKTQNQELTQTNQQLRLEIERVVQSALRLRQVADPTWGGASGTAIAPTSIPAELLAPPSPPQDVADLLPSPEMPPLFTQQELPPVQPTASEPTTEVSTWWLVLTIVLIVVSAFGTGFLIVRPLLPSR